MCSRYEINGTFDEVVLRFDISAGAQMIETFGRMAEVRPTNRVPVITGPGQVTSLSWGLKVDWDNKPIINARSETLSEKPTFQPLLENRCLIPATAYFEWRKDGKLKIKTRIEPNKGALVGMAGLIDGDTFTVITCQPSPSIAHIHNRMPVILDQPDEAAWLAPDNAFTDVAKLLAPYPDDQLQAEEVAPTAPKPSKQGDLFK